MLTPMIYKGIICKEQEMAWITQIAWTSNFFDTNYGDKLYKSISCKRKKARNTNHVHAALKPMLICYKALKKMQ